MALTTIDTYGIKDGAVQIDDIGTLAGNLTINDSGKLRVGTGLDLQLYHDGTNSYIDSQTGDLLIRSNVGSGDDVVIRSADNFVVSVQGTENAIVASGNGGVFLYYDGSIKFETSSAGASVTGDLNVGGGVQLDAAAAIDSTPHTYVYATGSDSGGLYIEGAESAIDVVASDGGTHGASFLLRTSVNGAGFNYNPTDNALELKTFVTSANDFTIHSTGANVSDLNTCARFVLGGAVELYYDNSKKFETTSTSVQVHGHVDVQSASSVYLQDNGKVQLGTSQDLQIYHNGASNWIDSVNNSALIVRAGTGDLYLQGGNVYIGDEGAAEKYIDGHKDGAVELYYDNSKKLETTSVGMRLSGNYQANDGYHIYLGTGNDLDIYHSGSHSYIDDTNNSGNLYIKGGGLWLRDTGNGGIQNGDGTENHIQWHNDGNVELYYDSDRKFRTTTTGAVVESVTGDVQIVVHAEEDASTSDAILKAYTANTSASCYLMFGDSDDSFRGGLKYENNGDKLEFWANNTTNWSITSDGSLNSGADNKELRLGASADLRLYHNGSHSIIDNDTGDLYIGSSNIVLMNGALTENKLRGLNNAQVELYYDNVKKLETTSSGIGVTGTIASVSTNDLKLSTASAGADIQFQLNGSTVMTLQNTSKLEVNDNFEIVWGNGSDLRIYHEGSNSYIHDGGTGGLRLRGNEINAVNEANSEWIWRAFENGAVELYYDHSKKLETYSNGVYIYDYLFLHDDDKLICGHNSDLQIYHSGGDNWIKTAVAGVHLKIIDAGGDPQIICYQDSEVQLYYNGSEVLNTDPYGVEIKSPNANESTILLLTGHEAKSAQLRFQADEGDDNSDLWRFVADTDNAFKIQSYANGSWEKCIHAYANGAVELYYNNSKYLETKSGGVKVSGQLTVTGTGSSFVTPVTFKDQSDNTIGYFGGAAVDLHYDGTRKFETTSSGIKVIGTVNETSDIALKSELVPIGNALSKIKQLKGYSYTFKDNGDKSIGLTAQDVETVYPALVRGEEGSKTLQYNGLIAPLIEAIKELSAEVDTLKAKLMGSENS